jgi:hypothetical protein
MQRPRDVSTNATSGLAAPIRRADQPAERTTGGFAVGFAARLVALVCLSRLQLPRVTHVKLGGCHDVFDRAKCLQVVYYSPRVPP